MASPCRSDHPTPVHHVGRPHDLSHTALSVEIDPRARTATTFPYREDIPHADLPETAKYVTRPSAPVGTQACRQALRRTKPHDRRPRPGSAVLRWPPMRALRRQSPPSLGPLRRPPTLPLPVVQAYHERSDEHRLRQNPPPSPLATLRRTPHRRSLGPGVRASAWNRQGHGLALASSPARRPRDARTSGTEGHHRNTRDQLRFLAKGLATPARRDRHSSSTQAPRRSPVERITAPSLGRTGA